MSEFEARNKAFSRGQTDVQFAYIEAECEIRRLEEENARLRELARLHGGVLDGQPAPTPTACGARDARRDRGHGDETEMSDEYKELFERYRDSYVEYVGRYNNVVKERDAYRAVAKWNADECNELKATMDELHARLDEYKQTHVELPKDASGRHWRIGDATARTGTVECLLLRQDGWAIDCGGHVLHDPASFDHVEKGD